MRYLILCEQAAIRKPNVHATKRAKLQLAAGKTAFGARLSLRGGGSHVARTGLSTKQVDREQAQATYYHTLGDCIIIMALSLSKTISSSSGGFPQQSSGGLPVEERSRPLPKQTERLVLRRVQLDLQILHCVPRNSSAFGGSMPAIPSVSPTSHRSTPKAYIIQSRLQRM